MNYYKNIGYYINVFFNIIGAGYLGYTVIDYCGFNLNFTLVKALVMGFGAVVGFKMYEIIQRISRKEN